MRRRESKPFRGVRPINEIVPILYGERDFDAFDDFGDFVESVSYGVSKTCQVPWFESMPGSHLFVSMTYKTAVLLLYEFCTDTSMRFSRTR